jgi:hypothetical protein
MTGASMIGKTLGQALFRRMYSNVTRQDGHPWNISPDGKRFLMMKEAGLVGAAKAEDPAENKHRS